MSDENELRLQLYFGLWVAFLIWTVWLVTGKIYVFILMVCALSGMGGLGYYLGYCRGRHVTWLEETARFYARDAAPPTTPPQ